MYSQMNCLIENDYIKGTFQKKTSPMYSQMNCLIENDYIKGTFQKKKITYVFPNELPNWKRLHKVNFLGTLVFTNELPNWKRIHKVNFLGTLVFTNELNVSPSFFTRMWLGYPGPKMAIASTHQVSTAEKTSHARLWWRLVGVVCLKRSKMNKWQWIRQLVAGAGQTVSRFWMLLWTGGVTPVPIRTCQNHTSHRTQLWIPVCCLVHSGHWSSTGGRFGQHIGASVPFAGPATGAQRNRGFAKSLKNSMMCRPTSCSENGGATCLGQTPDLHVDDAAGFPWHVWLEMAWNGHVWHSRLCQIISFAVTRCVAMWCTVS